MQTHCRGQNRSKDLTKIVLFMCNVASSEYNSQHECFIKNYQRETWWCQSCLGLFLAILRQCKEANHNTPWTVAQHIPINDRININFLFIFLVSIDPCWRALCVLHQSRGNPGEDHSHCRLLLLQPFAQAHCTLLRWGWRIEPLGYTGTSFLKVPSEHLCLTIATE